MTTPGSPSRHTPGKAIAIRDRILSDLSNRWGLTIQPPNDGESPSKRLEKLAIGRKAETYPGECFFKIHFLCLKNETALLTALNTFEYAAGALQSGWVYKPNADDDLLPRSPRSKPIVTAAQREQLFHCLLHCITPAFNETKERQRKNATTATNIKSLNDPPHLVFTPRHVIERHITDEQFDDTPIPFRLDTKGQGKRQSDGDGEQKDISKRTKGLPDDSASQRVLEAIDSVPVVTRQTEPEAWLTVTQPIQIASSFASSVEAAFEIPEIRQNASHCDRNQRGKGKQPETANTSFTSNTSVFSSMFDEDMSDASDELYFSTQTSVVDTPFDRRGTQEREPSVEMEDTQYGSTISDLDMVDTASFTPEEILREKLQNVFREYLYPY